MHGSPELLEFYLVEATEYIDALHELVAADAHGGPDTNALLATARALRGSSTMAKVEPIAELSLLLEQLAIHGRENEFEWSAELQQALRGAVNDLRFCVRGVRVWSDREQARVDARMTDLRRFLPGERRRAAPPPSESTTPVFVALQAAAIAAELDAFVATPTSRRALDDAIGRTRTLRGIAGIGDFPPLADVAEAVERGARALMPDAPLSPEDVELFHSAAALFRGAAEQLRSSTTYTARAAEIERFTAATMRPEPPAETATPVVRIEQLFYADQGPHIIERPPAPPVPPEQKLHNELVARSEHLHRLITEGRGAADPVARARVTRDLKVTVREIETLAASFGAHQLSAFFADIGEAGDLVAPAELDALASAARVTMTPFPSLDELERRMAVVQRARRVTPPSSPVVPAAPAAAAAPARAPVAAPATAPAVAPTHAPAAPQRSSATPTGRALQDLLRTGIEGFRSLDADPLSPPADLGAGEVVDIESLTFRGPTALARAIELRDDLLARGTPQDEALREIFDLLDLARAE